MTLSLLSRPRAMLAAALLAGASVALQTADDAPPAARAWSVTRVGTDRTAHAPTPNCFRDASAQAGETLRFVATVQPPIRGRYRFHVESANLTLELDARGSSPDANGESTGFEITHDGAFGHSDPPVVQSFATDWFESDGSPFAMSVEWTTLAAGQAHGRILWEREFDELGGFPPEPISSRALVATEENVAARSGVAFEALLEKKGCWNCHTTTDAAAKGRPAPKLDEVRQRAGTAWLRDWISAPHAMRPGADMPQVLFGTDEEIDEQATALARFLESLSAAPEASAAATEPEVLKRGRDLYHAVGCVACHGALVSPAELLDDPYSSNDLPQGPLVAPFGALEGKWRPAALSAFLQDPLATHPDGRMPSLNLSAEEADSIANYLADHFGPARDLLGEASADQIALGRKLFVAQRCNACHTLESLDLPKLDAAGPLEGRDFAGACVSAKLPADLAVAPYYEFDAATRAALGRFLSDQLAEQPADAGLASRSIALAMERHACRACHVVDGVGGPADDAKVYFWTAQEETDLGDEGRFPPDLSGVGHKLTTHWMREVLMNGGVARPYMATRMPQFGEGHMDGLAELFAQQEGIPPDTDATPPVLNDELVMTGRELMGLDKLACITCHVYKDFPPLSTDGPDITAFAGRLRYEWWRSYVHDPQRYKPGTRMPSFGTGNVSTFKDVLEGDLTQQADALWAYMNLGDFMPVPEGLESESEMIIAVGERPVVMRAFLPEVGARGIAVGHPNGVHYAFDAEAVRLVHAWSGEFLDAAGSWAGRGGSENDELGEVVWRAEPGPAIWFGAPLESWPSEEDAKGRFEFRGYRIEDDGSPTFLYSYGGLQIAEHVEVVIQTPTLLRREFTVVGLGETDLVHKRRPSVESLAATGGHMFGPDDALIGGSGIMHAGIEDSTGNRWDSFEPQLDGPEGTYWFTILQPLRND